MSDSFDLQPCTEEELGFDPALFAPLLMSSGAFAVVDLETTGLPNDTAAEILEFGILTFDAVGGAPASDDIFASVDPPEVVVRKLSGVVRPRQPSARNAGGSASGEKIRLITSKFTMP